MSTQSGRLEHNMELQEIKAVIDLMTNNGLTEFELEKGDFKLRVKRGPEEQPTLSITPAFPFQHALPAAPISQSSAPLAPAIPAPAQPVPTGAPLHIIVSPMVGTFYRSPSPTSPVFVEVGQEVHEDTVVCIIEAMKVMNEIKAECSGTIVEVLAANEKPVEFDKPLFSVRKK